MFPFRPAAERRGTDWEDLVKRLQPEIPGWVFVKSKEVCRTKEEYYLLLARAKIVVSTSVQETWGIAVQEAVLLGCIVIGAVSGLEGQDRKRAFMDLMTKVMAIGIEAATGQAPTWGDPEDAPEHERAGHG